MNTKYYIQMFARLEPETPWQVGCVADTDVLSLDDAARLASKQAGTEILPADFLRSAARGEISLKAIVHHDAKLKKHDGGIYCNQGLPTENTTPKGAIPTLPLSACQQLANAGRASWRTYDGFESEDGELMRFTIATLDDGEPDFETVPTDCRVMGWDARALADAYIDKPATKGSETPPAAPSGAPDSNEPPAPAARSEGKRGITKAEILAAEWPLPSNAPNLKSTLGKIPKWVDVACIKVGRAGKGQSGSHLWNPAVLAVCLATRTPHKRWICHQAPLTDLIRSQFWDYLDEWTKKQEML